MRRTDEGAKRPVTRRSRLLVVRCARGAVFRHTNNLLVTVLLVKATSVIYIYFFVIVLEGDVDKYCSSRRSGVAGVHSNPQHCSGSRNNY